MDDALLNEFISESREHLANIEADLLAIEEGGADIDEELVNKVFRAAHSIKGGSGFFGLGRVKDLAHGAETVLQMLRSRQMIPNAEITNILLAAFDKLRDMINHPAESETADISELQDSLTSLASSYLPQGQKATLTGKIRLAPGQAGVEVTLPRADFERARQRGHSVYCVDYDLVNDIERRGRTVLDVFSELQQAGEILDCQVDSKAAGTLECPADERLPMRLVFSTVIAPSEIDVLFPAGQCTLTVLFDPSKPSAAALPDAGTTAGQSATQRPKPVEAPAAESMAAPEPPVPPTVPPQTSTAAPIARSSTAGPGSSVSPEETIRIGVGLLERLMNLAGELVLARNQLRASIAQKNSQALATADQRINQVTSELQDTIMQTRLQPVGNVFNKFPRVVRDMAGALGKEVQLDIRGKDVALDKSLIEGLSDPLTHMVRNCVDHGIEMPADRDRAGKKRQGTVRIEARHEAGQVVVEVADDGRGLDPERIARAAISKGLLSTEKVQGMSAQEKIALIFLPGLSTAEKVTDLSGRGVGMDVVKTNLDRLGGKVEIHSEVGAGSTFRIKLPLTLTIIPSLIVSVEGQRFAIPQINVEELLRVQPENTKTRIEVVAGAEVLVLRNRLIPLVRFADLLGVTPTYVDPNTGCREADRRARLADRRSPRHTVKGPTGPDGAAARSEERRAEDRRRNPAGALDVVVVTTGTQAFGLVVSSFHDNEEIVVKPLGRHLKRLDEYAGATILGDGTVALILDAAGLAAKADLAAVAGTARAREQSEAAEQERLADYHSLLLFHNEPEELCAMPLDMVLRVERIRRDQIENVGGRRTMQYRGGSLPLVTLADVAEVAPISDARDLAVIVSSVRGREVGLLGAMPVDVTEIRTVVDQATHRQKGVAGSVVIGDHTVLIADLFEIVDASFPDWGAASTETKESAVSGHRAEEDDTGAVLLAEDSDFFRVQVARFIEEGGYPVVAAADGQEAWERLSAEPDKFRIVVTDIEMPRMTGLELARRIRADQRTAGLPVIALTSLAAEEDFARGRAAGIDDYQVKLDRDRLLERLKACWAAGPAGGRAGSASR